MSQLEQLFLLSEAVGRLRRELDDQERNLYIVAGVLGGVCAVLIIAVIALLFIVAQVKKKIREAEEKKRIEDEMNAQKFATYTGEELHRKLLSVSTPAVPLSHVGKESEYAFNAALADARVLSPPPVAPGKLHRY